MWSRKRALSREGRNDTKNNYANPTKPVLYCGCLPGCGGATNAARIRQSTFPHCGGYRNNPDIASVFHSELREGWVSISIPAPLPGPLPPGFDTPVCRPDGAQAMAREGVSDVSQDASRGNDGPNAPRRESYPVLGSRDAQGTLLGGGMARGAGSGENAPLPTTPEGQEGITRKSFARAPGPGWDSWLWTAGDLGGQEMEARGLVRVGRAGSLLRSVPGAVDSPIIPCLGRRGWWAMCLRRSFCSACWPWGGGGRGASDIGGISV